MSDDTSRDAERIKKELIKLIKGIEFACECDLTAEVNTLHEFVMIVLKRDREERASGTTREKAEKYADEIEYRLPVLDKFTLVGCLCHAIEREHRDPIEAGLLRLGEEFNQVELVSCDDDNQWACVTTDDGGHGAWHYAATPSEAVRKAVEALK